MSIFNLSRLVGKTALITGASSGIGRETAILFAKAGTNIIITARRKENLEETAKLAREAASNVKVETIQLDVTNLAALEDFGKTLEQRNIDILVNNAGKALGRDPVGSLQTADIAEVFQTNVIGLITLTNIFAAYFKKRDAGHIINLGSIAGREAYPGGAIYCSTKFAVRAFTTATLKELHNTNVRVTEIAPGMVETEFTVVRFRGDKDSADKLYQGFHPLTPVDIAEEIVWAASRPEHVELAEVFVLPSAQATAGTVHRA